MYFNTLLEVLKLKMMKMWIKVLIAGLGCCLLYPPAQVYACKKSVKFLTKSNLFQQSTAIYLYKRKCGDYWATVCWWLMNKLVFYCLPLQLSPINFVVAGLNVYPIKVSMLYQNETQIPSSYTVLFV